MWMADESVDENAFFVVRERVVSEIVPLVTFPKNERRECLSDPDIAVDFELSRYSAYSACLIADAVNLVA
jgi:hypothetical protein